MPPAGGTFFSAILLVVLAVLGVGQVAEVKLQLFAAFGAADLTAVQGILVENDFFLADGAGGLEIGLIVIVVLLVLVIFFVFVVMLCAAPFLDAQQGAGLSPAEKQRRLDIEKELQSIAVVDRKVMLPMPDGVRLATDVYRPKNAAGKVPVNGKKAKPAGLEYTPSISIEAPRANILKKATC